jgi:choline kinase
MSIKVIRENKNNIDILIPAAGYGKRMKTWGAKALIQIKNNLILIDHQIKILRKFLPKSNIIIVCGYDSINLMNHLPSDIIKIENEMFEQTNVTRSIGMGLRACMNNVLLVYGDLVFNEYAISSFSFNKSSTLVGEHMMVENEVGCTIDENNFIENMMYELPTKWSQISFFTGKELAMLKQICWNQNNKNLFGFETINKIVAGGGKINAIYNKKAKVIDIDTTKDLDEVIKII